MIRFIAHNDIGYNTRLNNLSAAVGLGQIKILIKYYEKKKIHTEYKKKFLRLKNFKLILNRSQTKVNYWLNIILFSKKINRKKLINELKDNQIETRPIWFANHLQLKMKNFKNLK